MNLMILDISKEIHILRYRCNSQAVESCVRLVREAAAAICGNTGRDGLIRLRMVSNIALPKFDT